MARRRERRGRAVDADAVGVRQLVQERDQKTTRAGAEIQNAQPRDPIRDGGERRLDDGFRIGPGHERLGREREGQAPEFLLPENAGDRFMDEPPGDMVEQKLRTCGAERHVRRHRQRGSIHAERLAEEDARIARRAVEAGLGKGTAGEPEGLGPRRSGGKTRQGSRPLGRELRGLVLGRERVDDLVERRARHHLLEPVEGEVDAVVGHPALREVVGPDALRAVARPDLRAAVGGTRLILAVRSAS